MTTPQGCEIASREGKRERPPRRPPPARAPAPATATAAPSARACSSWPIRVPKRSADDAGGGAESHAEPSKVARPLGDDAGGPGPAPGPPRRDRHLRRPVTFRALEGGRRCRETPAAAAPPQESSRGGGGGSGGARTTPTPGIGPRVAPERGDGGGESGPALGADEAAGEEEAEEEEAERRREAAVGPRAAWKRHFDFWWQGGLFSNTDVLLKPSGLLVLQGSNADLDAVLRER
ncbi:uncharacterized protein LOC142920172 [Petromyzon marinus]|uniref:uncharacterized protein LOC142920172 n=1 Tax=Petromyzon marinus TaxID=7757 RepID=UPI003F7073E4